MPTLLLLLLPALAAGPRPLFTATASGAAVDLDLRIYERGEPGMGDVWNLARLREEEVYPILTDHTFTTELATGSGLDCYEVADDTGFPGCDAAPEECTDCDGDGTPECTPGGECVRWYTFVVREACVLPGDWGYELAAEGASGSFTTYAAVEDLGQDCADTGDTGDTGDAGDSGDDPPEPKDGCLCGGGSAPATLWAVLAGLVLAGRRRRD